MNNYYSRIKEYIIKKQIPSVRRFEIDADIANGTIGKLKEDDGKGLHTDTIDKIAAQYSDLNIEWLRTGRGSMIKESKSTGLQKAEKLEGDRDEEASKAEYWKKKHDEVLEKYVRLLEKNQGGK